MCVNSITVFGSNKRVWWKGACGHEWETSVKARSKGEKCPICSGARVIEGINDLATLKPLLAQEWSEKNELKPTEVSVASLVGKVPYFWGGKSPAGWNDEWNTQKLVTAAGSTTRGIPMPSTIRIVVMMVS